MHCPHCRHDNAATTRFCTSCGAVLVEEAPGGGRRRVLRPWGLRRDAPLTVSPDFPEDAPMPPRDTGRRVDLWLAGGVAAVVLTVATLHPWGPAPVSHATVAETSAPPLVATVPVSGTAVHEVRLSAPALVEPLPAPAKPAAHDVAPAPVAPPTARLSAKGPAAVPVTYAVPSRPAVIADGESVEVVAAASVAPPPPPAPAPDRWQTLRDGLASCTSLALLQRAMCEQGARLAHCDGYWGQVTLCPAGRTEFGQ
jgi:hypothetical protein